MPAIVRPALLCPGDRAARDRSDPAESRFAALFEAFAQAGIAAEPAIYHDDFADEVAAQVRQVDAVLVWCNPIEGGRRRDRLDALLRDASQAGVLVSAARPGCRPARAQKPMSSGLPTKVQWRSASTARVFPLPPLN